MPIPTCICCICGQVVNKSTTYSVGPGHRACKSHQGVSDQAQAIQDKAKADKLAVEQREAEKKKRRWEESTSNPNFMENARKWSQETCWTCGRPALPLQSFYNRMLVALQKSRIRGDHSATNAILLGDKESVEQTQKDLGLPIGTIFYRALELPQDHNERLKLLRDIKGGPDKREVANISGMIHICKDCCDKHGLKFEPEMPKIDLTTMAVLGAMLPPVFENIAKKELEVDKLPPPS